jgi:hypothetical protein
VGLLALLAWLYAPVLDHGFVMFDDDVNLYGNPHIGELTVERFVWAWTGHDYMPRVMPVAWLTVMALFGLGGMEPTVFHAYNLAMHAANTVLVFALATLALRLAARSRGRAVDASRQAWVALAAAALWGLHPLRSESIAWATGWIYPTVTFFALAAGWLALRRHEFADARRRWLLAAAVAAYGLSALTYPVTLGFPAALLAFEWWLGRGGREGGFAELADWRGLARARAIFFAIAGLALAGNVWARVAKNKFYPPAPAIEVFTVENRVAQAARTVPHYALRMLWPGQTTPVQDLRDPARLRDWPEAGWMALLVVIGVAALATARRAPGGAAALTAYLAATAPFSGLLDYPFQASDRYGYFPGVTVVLAGALAAAGWLSAARSRARWVAGGVAGAWAIWFAASVPAQLGKWKDSEALFGYLGATLKSMEGQVAYGTSQALARAMRGDFAAANALMDELAARGADPEALRERRGLIERLEAIARAPMSIANARGLVAPDAVLAYKFALRDAEAGEQQGADFRFKQALAADADFHDARHRHALLLASWGRVAEAKAQRDELVRRAGAALSEAERARLDDFIRRADEATGGGA